MGLPLSPSSSHHVGEANLAPQENQPPPQRGIFTEITLVELFVADQTEDQRNYSVAQGNPERKGRHGQ